MQDTKINEHRRIPYKQALRGIDFRLSCPIWGPLGPYASALSPDPALGPQEESKIPAGSAAHERSSSMIRAPAIWCDRALMRAHEGPWARIAQHERAKGERTMQKRARRAKVSLFPTKNPGPKDRFYSPSNGSSPI